MFPSIPMDCHLDLTFEGIESVSFPLYIADTENSFLLNKVNKGITVSIKGLLFTNTHGFI